MLGAVLLVFLSCKTAGPVASPVPWRALPGVDPAKLGTVARDIIYGTAGNVLLKLDIYYPKACDGAVPAVVYVHGGGWTQGDKSGGAGAVEIPELVNRGYLVAAVNYRLAPQYQFPAQIEDVKNAIRFLRANAASYGVDTARFGAMGGSAGGHLVALLGTTDTSAGLEGAGGYADRSSRVQAVVDLFGPSDLSIMFPGNSVIILEQVFGTRDPRSEKARMASPVTYVSPDDPPFLILHGDKDTLVPLSQSRILYDRLLAAGVTANLVVVKNGGHGFTPVGGAISPTRLELTNAIADFFDKYLK